MSDDLITSENLTLALLKSVLDAAFMEASIDSEGDLLVKEQINCYIFIGEKKDRITLLARFGFQPTASRAERLEAVNSINKDYLIVRAVVGDQDVLRFTYDLLVPGEIGKRAFVLALKRFCAIPQVAVRDRAAGLVL